MTNTGLAQMWYLPCQQLPCGKVSSVCLGSIVVMKMLKLEHVDDARGVIIVLSWSLFQNIYISTVSPQVDVQKISVEIDLII